MKSIKDIKELINALSVTFTDWMLIVHDLEIAASNNSMDCMLETMKERYSVRINKSENKKDKSFKYNVAINSKDYDVDYNGYEEKWEMECKHCQQNNIFD